MKCYIDQSIKIEDTNKVSFVSLTNGTVCISSISAKDKQKLKLFFRELNKPLIFKLFTFSVLCSKVIILSKSGSILIDCEYSGHERQIKLFISQILLIEKIKCPDIWFGKVGRGSNAHKTVYKAMKSKNKGITVSAGEVLRYYEDISRA